MDQLLVGRQPIFDDKLDVYGYELLFRNPFGTTEDPDVMTADVLVHAGLDIGLDSLVGRKLAFVSATRSFLVGELAIALPPEQTVIEVPADVERDGAVLEGCRNLVREGYRLAICDYTYLESDRPLLELADFITFYSPASSPRELALQVQLCRGFAARLVASGIDTHERLAACRELGFGLFQGYLLSRPSTVASSIVTPSHLTCLRLVEKLCDSDVSAEEVAGIIETDAWLSYRFLRAAGMGAAQGLRRHLSSVREGIVLLGTRRLRDWVVLMLLADTHEGSTEQLTIAMTRARMCELLSEAVDPRLRDSAFTVGLLSALDLLLNVPLPEIIEHLSITDELVDALLAHTGPLGLILTDVLAWELGAEGLDQERDLATVAERYLRSLVWATDICGVLEHAH